MSRSIGPVFPNAAPGVDERRHHVERQHALADRALLVLQIGMMREDLLAVEILGPESRRRHDVLAPRRQVRRVRQREKRNALVVDLLDDDLLVERPVGDEMSRLVKAETGRSAQQHPAEPRCCRLYPARPAARP